MEFPLSIRQFIVSHSWQGWKSYNKKKGQDSCSFGDHFGRGNKLNCNIHQYVQFTSLTFRQHFSKASARSEPARRPPLNSLFPRGVALTHSNPTQLTELWRFYQFIFYHSCLLWMVIFFSLHLSEIYYIGKMIKSHDNFCILNKRKQLRAQVFA